MTITDVFNKALGMLGHDRTITEGSTGSTEYLRCNREWDGARLAVLTAHAWNWLVQETPLEEGAESLDDFSYANEYVYDRPGDMIRLLAVLDGNNRRVDYRTANGQIYSMLDELKFRYLVDNEIPDDWPTFIVDAIASELASRIAFAMSANAKMVQAVKQLQISYMSEAIRQDSSEENRAGTSNRYAASRR